MSVTQTHSERHRMRTAVCCFQECDFTVAVAKQQWLSSLHWVYFARVPLMGESSTPPADENQTSICPVHIRSMENAQPKEVRHEPSWTRIQRRKCNMRHVYAPLPGFLIPSSSFLYSNRSGTRSLS